MASPQVTGLVYARQSKDNADGIDRQIIDCTRLLEREGIPLGRVITDNDVSASTDKERPGYAALLAEMEARGSALVVVAQTQDRLLRRPIEMENLIPLVERSGARVMLVRAVFDLTTAMGRASARQAAVWARLEVEQKAERQRRQAEQAAGRGDAPSRRAFGYRPGGMELDPDEAPVVRAAFDALFRGDTLVRITDMMNGAGLPSVRGNRWHRKGVAYMLTSPRYAGVRTYHGKPVADGAWPCIVSREEHEKAVALLTDPMRKVNHLGTARRWLGSGLYVCGRCRASTMRTGRRTQGNVRTYVCREHAHLSRTAEPVDCLVRNVIAARLAAPDAADLLAGNSPEMSGLQGEREALEARIGKLRDQLARGVIEEDDYLPMKREVQAELTVIRRKLTVAARSSRLATLGASADPAGAFLAADLPVQRQVVDALCTVVLLPSARGASSFDPTSVGIEWRTS